MTTINIDDGHNTEYNMDYDELEWEVCNEYDLLNVREIRMRIAYNVIDEEVITRDVVNKKIGEYLKPLIDEILEETIETLKDNGFKIKE